MLDTYIHKSVIWWWTRMTNSYKSRQGQILRQANRRPTNVVKRTKTRRIPERHHGLQTFGCCCALCLELLGSFPIKRGSRWKENISGNLFTICLCNCYNIFLWVFSLVKYSLDPSTLCQRELSNQIFQKCYRSEFF